MKDGRRLVGKVFDDGEDGYRIVMRHGSLTVKRSEVDSIEKGPTPEDLYAEKASKMRWRTTVAASGM